MQGRELVAYILEHSGIGTDALASRLGVKERAMRKRILQANDDLSGIAHIVYKRSIPGYMVEVEDAEAFDAWLANDGHLNPSSALPATPIERVAYLLQDLLSRTDWITLEELSSMLFVSRSTLSNDLRQVEETLNRFGLELEKRPRHGIRVVGSEMSRRICLASIAVDATLGGEGASSDSDAAKLDVISRCVDEVLVNDGFKVSSFAHHNLIVHIAIALARIEKGCYVPLDPEQDESILSTREHAVAVHIAEGIGRIFNVELPESEVAYIAIHLASKRLLDSPGDAQDSEDNLVITDEAWTLASEMLETVWRAFRFDFRQDVELRMNLARHLMPLSVRLRYHMSLENALLPDIKERFPLAYSMAIDACGVLAEHFGTEPSEDEVGYIALSLALALERSKSDPVLRNVLVVCASGMGSARLLSYQIQQRFKGYIGSIDTCDAAEFDNRDLAGIDYVLTTVPLKRHVSIPVVEVSVFLSEDDRRDIKTAFEALDEDSARTCFSPALFFPHLPFSTREEVLSFMCAQIAAHEKVAPELEELVWKREEMATTSFGNLVALPHPYEPVSEHTFVAVGLCDREIPWNGKPVRAVFLVCVANDAGDELEAFYSSMVGLLTKQESIQHLLSDMEFETLLEELEGEVHD